MKLIYKMAAFSVAISIMLFSANSVTHAQEGMLAIEEITVTARKKEESLADAPYTITALTSQQIEMRGINQLSDVVGYTPGFFYSLLMAQQLLVLNLEALKMLNVSKY